MERYKNIKRNNGKYKTVKFPKIVPSGDDTIIVTKDTDRLDLLAQQYYGDQTMYWVIALANNLGHGTVEIPAGTTLRIPANLVGIINEYTSLNS